MSSEYGKVIIGESVDESAKPLLCGEAVEPDVEAQIYAQPIPQGQRVYESASRVPAVTVYGTYPAQRVIVERDPGEDCALMGCLLSWIPIIGVITFFVHCDAPPESRRAYWARTACIIASLVVFFNLVFWPVYEEEQGRN